MVNRGKTMEKHFSDCFSCLSYSFSVCKSFSSCRCDIWRHLRVLFSCEQTEHSALIFQMFSEPAHRLVLWFVHWFLMIGYSWPDAVFWLLMLQHLSRLKKVAGNRLIKGCSASLCKRQYMRPFWFEIRCVLKWHCFEVETPRWFPNTNIRNLRDFSKEKYKKNAFVCIMNQILT